MTRMALFGGTFDPVHAGHTHMAQRLAERLGLDGVLLMPAFVPPHKIRGQMAPAEDRLAMCRLAAEEDPLFSVSDMELRRGGASFTVETLEELHREYPDTEWYLFTGADMFLTLRTWYRFADIARLAVLCTVPRDGVTADQLREYAAHIEEAGATCYVADEPEWEVSSTEIRRRVLAGEPLDGLVSPAIEAYICAHGLYRTPQMAEKNAVREQYEAILRTRLGEYRYRHSLCVAEEARRLALRYGADAERAETAGLLHDIMKDMDEKTQLQILSDFGILMDTVTRGSPKLWHAVTGAAFLEHILHIGDPAILEAVRYHTTGRAGMSLLEKVLFVADFTSADRSYPDVDVMRRLCDESLEAAMLYGIVYTIRDLLDDGWAVHPDTVAAYNELIANQQT